MHDKIIITRQIVIGGRNRYLLNGHNVQQNQIQNLFHSVSLKLACPISNLSSLTEPLFVYHKGLQLSGVDLLPVARNVNNPHFLIMQGRITKVINMKPQETLSMIEEAAGTRMYENKKAGALKTLEKKQNKARSWPRACTGLMGAAKRRARQISSKTTYRLSILYSNQA